jgi:hypothetical protein
VDETGAVSGYKIEIKVQKCIIVHMDTVTSVTERILGMLEYKFAFCFKNSPSGFQMIVISHGDMQQEHLRFEELDGVLRSIKKNYPDTIKDFWVSTRTNKEREPEVKKASDFEYAPGSEIEVAPDFGVKVRFFREKFLAVQKTAGNGSNSPHVFNLSKDNILSRKIGDHTESCVIKNGSLRLRVIKELMRGKHGKFHKSNDMASLLKVEVRQIQKAVDGIRKYIEKTFNGFDGNDFIKGEKELGYRLVAFVKEAKK